jgi:hypothetical protein
MMPDNLCNVSVPQHPVLQQAATYTAPSFPIVPVYFIHSFEQPFCAEATCSCHALQQEVVRLFVKIVEGHLELEQAAHFQDDRHAERK